MLISSCVKQLNTRAVMETDAVGRDLTGIVTTCDILVGMCVSRRRHGFEIVRDTTDNEMGFTLR